MQSIALAVDWLVRLLMMVVVIDVVLGYFVDPYHPIRRRLDGLLAPILMPIRRAMPQTGTVDFSPMVLIFGLWIINMLLQSLLR